MIMYWGSAITDPGKRPGSLPIDETNNLLELVKIAIPFEHICKTYIKFVRGKEKGVRISQRPPTTQSQEQQFDVSGNSKSCYCWLVLHSSESTPSVQITF